MLLLLYAVIVRLKSILTPISYEIKESDTAVSHFIYRILPESGWGQAVVGIFLVFIQAALINRFSIRYKLEEQLSLIPGMIYILLSSFYPALLILSPALVASTFLIAGLLQSAQIYRVTDSGFNNFNAGVCFALAWFIHPPFFIFILTGFIGQVIMRSYSLREFAQYTFGLFSVVIIIFSIHFVQDDFRTLISKYFYFQYNLYDLLNWDTQKIIKLLLGLIPSLFFLINYTKILSKRVILATKVLNLVFWFLALGLIGFLLSLNQTAYIHALFIPFSILGAILLLRIKNPFIEEIIHLVLLMTLFAIQYNLIVI
ncbi:MAG TPA: DUF6427 family protein [Saprospiraceae bacterium]|nr:DUF6427 family protein [Saprospiraceae bacterium]